nr:MAG TPA: hypothetical protein [Caudoviricetes sp.]
MCYSLLVFANFDFLQIVLIFVDICTIYPFYRCKYRKSISEVRKLLRCFWRSRRDSNSKKTVENQWQLR